MYMRCSYVYPSGNQCSNPIPQHLDPPLCGGHCDSIDPPELAAPSTGSDEKQTDPPEEEHIATRTTESDSTKSKTLTTSDSDTMS